MIDISITLLLFSNFKKSLATEILRGISCAKNTFSWPRYRKLICSPSWPPKQNVFSAATQDKELRKQLI